MFVLSHPCPVAMSPCHLNNKLGPFESHLDDLVLEDRTQHCRFVSHFFNAFVEFRMGSILEKILQSALQHPLSNRKETAGIGALTVKYTEYMIELFCRMKQSIPKGKRTTQT